MEISCQCEKCVKICEQRPCWPTPQEALKLVESGFRDRLMVDYWVDNYGEIFVLSPAIRGYEGCDAPFLPLGKCTFLKDGLCELHDLGLKPIEGRRAGCSSGEKELLETEVIHEMVAMAWKEQTSVAIFAEGDKNDEDS